MLFVLSGFKQEGEFRVFSFEGINSEKVRSAFSVRINLSLSRRYGIRLQDLPLLCRGLLEKGGETPASRAVTFSESDMSEYSQACAARVAATQRRPGPRKPAGAELGSAWRRPQESE